MKNKALIWSLAGISAVLMSLPFLVPHCGFIALFALVPLLCAERIATQAGLKHFFWVHYACFVVFNALTTFWVCNATVGGGIFAVVANAFQMSVVFAIFRLSRKYFKGSLPYIILMCTWMAWEKYYLDSAQISWPWLVFGNAFARSIKCIQWYEYTGTLGGSLWVWASNLGIFGMMVALSDGSFFGKWNIKAKIASVAGLVAILIGPFIWSAVIWNRYEETDDKLEVFIAQPNIDPYHKFEFLTQKQQNEILLGQIEEGLADRKNDSTATSPLLILAPETFTGDAYILNGQLQSSTLVKFIDFLQDYPDVNIMFGASSYEYINSALAPSKTARKAGDKTWVESHNSALMTDRSGRLGIFHKSKLVVAVEMTPYPGFFCKIDDLLGGVMGRCIGQKEISNLNVAGSDGSKIPVGPVICYESIYGNYCRGYIEKGAKVLAIITNDAWWKDTPGYKQHLSYASLRAIETRRDIARCANTGVSAFIDQKGRILEKSHWWQKETMRGYVNLNTKKTFFVQYGDIIGRVCLFLSLMFSLALIVRVITSRSSASPRSPRKAK